MHTYYIMLLLKKKKKRKITKKEGRDCEYYPRAQSDHKNVIIF